MISVRTACFFGGSRVEFVGISTADEKMDFPWWYILIAVLPLPNLWSIWHIWSHEFASFQQKVGWLCLAVFLPVLAGIIYIVYGRRFALRKIQRAPEDGH